MATPDGVNRLLNGAPAESGAGPTRFSVGLYGFRSPVLPSTENLSEANLFAEVDQSRTLPCGNHPDKLNS